MGLILSDIRNQTVRRQHSWNDLCLNVNAADWQLRFMANELRIRKSPIDQEFVLDLQILII